MQNKRDWLILVGSVYKELELDRVAQDLRQEYTYNSISNYYGHVQKLFRKVALWGE